MSYSYDYTRLLVDDFAACFLFYNGVLGLEPTMGTEDDVYAEFKTGDTTLALFKREAMNEAIGTTALPAPAPAQDRVCLIFDVEDVDVESARLSGLGVTLLAEPADRPEWSIRTAHFRDPDGNLIEINQPLSD